MKIRKLMAGLTLAATMATAMMPVSAFAQVNEEDIIAEEQEEVTEEPTEESEEIISYGPLTPDGNLTIIDDYGDPTKAGKQFITVSSKNGNIFYIIIDRDDEGENTVHFLNLVDERDLLTLMDEEEIEEFMGPVEVEPTPTPEPEEPKEVVVEEPKPKSNIGGGSICIVLVLLVGGAGVFLYTRKKDGKKKNTPYVDPDADYEDDDYEDDIPEEADDVEIPMEDESLDEDLSDE